LIRDANGDRFVDELLPRDEVSRAITARMHEQGIDHVWLDVTTIENFEVRFPTIAATLSEVGLDPSHEWLPIAPAAHYMSGGILADLDGASSLPGLWAAGETACSGVHGANRLASNSLLDGMVFGARVVEAVERGKDAPEATGAMRAILDSGDGGFTIPGRIIEGWRGEGSVDAVAGFASLGVEKRREELQRAMTRGAGVLRSADSLAGTRRIVDGVLAASADLEHGSQEEAELANLAEVARALLVGATVREESRGAHTREDFPERDDEHFQVRLVLR
jgi:L-aspartate oxidase